MHELTTLLVWKRAYVSKDLSPAAREADLGNYLTQLEQALFGHSLDLFHDLLEKALFFLLLDVALEENLGATLPQLAAQLHTTRGRVASRLERLQANDLICVQKFGTVYVYYVPLQHRFLHAIFQDLVALHINHTRDLPTLSVATYAQQFWTSYLTDAPQLSPSSVTGRFPFIDYLECQLFWSIQQAVHAGQVGITTNELLRSFPSSRPSITRRLRRLVARKLVYPLTFGQARPYALPLTKNILPRLLHELATLLLQDFHTFHLAPALLTVKELAAQLLTTYLTDVQVLLGRPLDHWPGSQVNYTLAALTLRPWLTKRPKRPTRAEQVHRLFERLTTWFTPSLLAPVQAYLCSPSNPFAKKKHLLPVILGFIEALLRTQADTIRWTTLVEINEAFGTTLKKHDYLKHMLRARTALNLTLGEPYAIAQGLTDELLETCALAPQMTVTARRYAHQLLTRLQAQGFGFKDIEVLAWLVCRLVLHEAGRLSMPRLVSVKVSRLLYRVRHHLQTNEAGHIGTTSKPSAINLITPHMGEPINRRETTDSP